MDAESDFKAFYQEAKDRVFQAVLASGRDPVRAEDAVAEAFARAFERWSVVGQMDHPTAWVVRVALNRYNSAWRIWRRELPEPPDTPGPPDEGPMDEVLVRLVWHLPRRQRQVLALRILADLSEEDTGQALGISPKTVSVHLHRAIQHLRTSLAESQTEAHKWKTQTLPAK
jgi:RNA polymerase sigma-70 factor (ECF subfamily)